MPDKAVIAIEEMSDRRVTRRRLTIDLVTSYALSLSRVVAWAIVSMLIARRAGFDTLAIVALVRGTLNVVAAIPTALTPTFVKGYVDADASLARPAFADRVDDVPDTSTLSYQPRPPVARRLRDNARLTCWCCILVIVLLGSQYAKHVVHLHSFHVDAQSANAIQTLAALTVASIMLRALGEPAAARLQATDRLWIDNAALIAAELTWIVTVSSGRGGATAILERVGLGLALGQVIAFVVRSGADQSRSSRMRCSTLLVPLLLTAALLFLGSLADYLYGPSNQILIDRSLGRSALVAYVPCLQVDGALLLIVSGIGVALFPRIARHARGHALTSIRRDYVVGTLVSLAMLAVASIAAWLLAPFAIRHWLGVVPAGTLAILPLVLVHTVVGGTAGIGRAVLLGLGRFKAYTLSALVGGVANVLLALLFVLGFHWGLRGVVFATIVAVVGRCAIWMPWYILRALRAPPIAPLSDAGVR